MKSLMRDRTTSLFDKARVLLTTPTDVTATADGTTTAIVPAGTEYVNVIGVTGQVNYWITLPAMSVGDVIYLRNISTFTCEVRTSNATTIFFNGGASTGKEIVMATNKFFTVTCLTATMLHLESVDYPLAD